MIKDWVIPNEAIKVPLPDTLQYKNFTCGGIALKSVLEYYGIGKFTEQQMVDELQMTEEGTDPYQIINVLDKYKMCYLEYRPMSVEQLKDFLEKGKPVFIMLQAWGENKKYYRDDWTEGHWVVAIGYDSKGFYFEDPSLVRKRGYIIFDELNDRWHDVEGHDESHVEHYGLVLWSTSVKSKNINTNKANYIE